MLRLRCERARDQSKRVGTSISLMASPSCRARVRRLLVILAAAPFACGTEPTAHWIYAATPGAPSDATAQQQTWGAASATCVEAWPNRRWTS